MEAALVGARWRFENVITENLAAYQSSQQWAYLGKIRANRGKAQEGIYPSPNLLEIGNLP